MIYISYDRSIYIIYISNIICISYNRSEMRSIVIDRDRRLWCGTRALRIYQVRVPFFCFSFSLVWYPHFACLPDTNSLVFNKKIVCGAVSALRIYQARISFFVFSSLSSILVLWLIIIYFDPSFAFVSHLFVTIMCFSLVQSRGKGRHCRRRVSLPLWCRLQPRWVVVRCWYRQPPRASVACRKRRVCAQGRNGRVGTGAVQTPARSVPWRR